MLGTACDTRGPGVYAIVSLCSQRVYVGSSVNINRRWIEHRSRLRGGSHRNPKLQIEWARYGEPFFAFVVLERTPSEYAPRIAREQWWIDSTPDMLNISTQAGSGPKPGHKMTPAQVEKMRAAMKGRPKSAAHRAHLSAARKGLKVPKQAEAMRGRTVSPDTCAKMSAAHKGLVKSPACRAKLSTALKGREFTPEWKEKISAAKRGQPWSDKRRAALPVPRT